jgi:hypothetical protein
MNFGYLAGEPTDLSVQQAAVAAFAASRAWPVAGCFWDTAGLDRQLQLRDQGALLCRRIDRSDRVLVAGFEAFRDIRDLLNTVSWWQRRGVATAFATDEAAGQLALRFLVEVAAGQQRQLSAQKKQGAARLKSENRRINQWPVKGYGFRQSGGKAVMVGEEAWVVLQIVQLRSQSPPCSWHQLYRLLTQEVRWRARCDWPLLPDARGHPRQRCDCGSRARQLLTRTNRPWTKRRIERVWQAHQAAQQRQEQGGGLTAE